LLTNRSPSLTFRSLVRLPDKRTINYDFRTIFVESMLNKLPSKTTKLGVVINSDSGSPAQAHIINTKLSILSKRRGIEIYTFIEDAAVNAGFLLATGGQKIFADNTSIIGGLEVSNKKIVLGDFINRISYKNESSLSS
jgi:ClpP class serine protease